VKPELWTQADVDKFQ